VFTFVDRERTAQENTVNPTETALAQLYAHIQGLPESSKKKRLIKQFNKENGHGTPRTKTLGDSIKVFVLVFLYLYHIILKRILTNVILNFQKHIFCKGLKKAFNDTTHMKIMGTSSDELLVCALLYLFIYYSLNYA
jgi:hypothetical protein